MKSMIERRNCQKAGSEVFTGCSQSPPCQYIVPLFLQAVLSVRVKENDVSPDIDIGASGVSVAHYVNPVVTLDHTFSKVVDCVASRNPTSVSIHVGIGRTIGHQLYCFDSVWIGVFQRSVLNVR